MYSVTLIVAFVPSECLHYNSEIHIRSVTHLGYSSVFMTTSAFSSSAIKLSLLWMRLHVVAKLKILDIIPAPATHVNMDRSVACDLTTPIQCGSLDMCFRRSLE